MTSTGQFEGLHKEVTEKVLGAFFGVTNELGFGFVESVYRRSMLVALRQAGLKAEEEVAIPVHFRGVPVGNFFADLVVNDVVVLELKVADEVSKSFEAQLLHYLRATHMEVGLVLTFGERPRFRRVVFANERKRMKTSP